MIKEQDVCMFVRISLTAVPIYFYLTGYLNIGPGKVYNYLGEVENHPQKKKNLPSQNF